MGNKLIERVHQRADFVAPPVGSPHGQVAIPCARVQIVAQMQHLAGHPGAPHTRRRPAPAARSGASRPPSARPKRRESASIWSMRAYRLSRLCWRSRPSARGVTSAWISAPGRVRRARHVQLAGGRLFRHLVAWAKYWAEAWLASRISRHAVGVLQTASAGFADRAFLPAPAVGVAGGGGAIEAG